MVNKVLTFLLALAVAGLFCAGTAQADLTIPTGGGHGGGGGGGDDGSSQSSSGGSQHTTVKSCSLYATSSNYGLSCITGTAGDAPTVKKILKGDPKDFCWDVRLTTEQIVKEYQIENQYDPEAPPYLHSCITGLDEGNTVYHQPGMQLNQLVVDIPITAHACPAKHYEAELVGTCTMQLTDPQQQIVSQTAARAGQIPGITLVTKPATKVRTAQDVAYIDVATDHNGNRITETPHQSVGGVQMWAQMTSYEIYPYGPDGGTRIRCKGTTPVPDDAKPPANVGPNTSCWWSYPRSSADQPHQAYPFRAEADWTVYYSAGGAPVAFASFQKYDDVQLTVDDVQSLVIK